MGAIIEAFATTRPVVEVLGPNLILFLKNDEGNVRKLRKVWAKQIDESLGQAEPHNRCASLRGLLQTESASGIHKAGGVPNPNPTRTLTLTLTLTLTSIRRAACLTLILTLTLTLTPPSPSP